MVTEGIQKAGKLLQATRWQEYLPIIAGLSVLYLPTLFRLFDEVWRSDEQAHGPIVLAVACWLAWRKWPLMLAESTPTRPNRWGWAVFVLSLLVYSLGRALDILIFEVGSSIGVLAGILLVVRGFSAVRAQWFALFFLFFMLPLPGPLVDALTMPMKMAVSYVAEHVLFEVGY